MEKVKIKTNKIDYYAYKTFQIFNCLIFAIMLFPQISQGQQIAIPENVDADAFLSIAPLTVKITSISCEKSELTLNASNYKLLIKATVINNLNMKVSSPSVELHLYDKYGNLVGSPILNSALELKKAATTENYTFYMKSPLFCTDGENMCQFCDTVNSSDPNGYTYLVTLRWAQITLENEGVFSSYIIEPKN